MKILNIIALFAILSLSSCREEGNYKNVNVKVDGEGKDVKINADDPAILGDDEEVLDSLRKVNTQGMTTIADSVSVDTTRIKVDQ